MSRVFSDPVAISHQGKAIYFARFLDGDGDAGIAYNILDPRLESADDDLDWTGYQTLPVSAGLAPAGMSVLESRRSLASASLLCAVTDQTHVYLFTADAETVFCQRYLMVENPAVGDTSARYVLQVAWQVRFQCSESADVPASDKDTLSFMNKEGQPFDEPVLQLAFGTGDPGVPLDIAGGRFWVCLVPGGIDADFRWQFLLVNRRDAHLYAYSMARGADGLPVVDPGLVDPATKTLNPDAVVALTLADGAGDLPVTLCGPPNAAVYLKQEPVLTETQGVLRMSQVQRLLLTARVRVEQGAGATFGLATLDFAVGNGGRLALLEPQPDGVPVRRTFTAGRVSPAEYSLDFDGRSEVLLQELDGYVPGATFTLEAWVYPTNADLDDHGVLGGETGAAASPPTLWVTDRRRVGVGFGVEDEEEPHFVEALSDGDILVPHAWNHLAFAYDPSGGPRLFHNGRPVAIDGTLVAGLTPAGAPLTRLGAGRERWLGLIDEVRCWNEALDGAAIRQRMYREIPAAEAAADESLRAYWRLDEGTGSRVEDLARKGNGGAGYEGQLSGPQWVARTAPVQPDTAPIAYFDARGLSVSVGIIVPEAGLTQRFGALAEDTRTWLLAGSDGLLHCYYEDPDGQAIVAHYDTAITRASYAAPWVAGPTEGGGAQRGWLLFAARQSGSVGNIAGVVVDADLAHPLLSDILLAEARDEAGVEAALAQARGQAPTPGGPPRGRDDRGVARRERLAGAQLGARTAAETWKGVVKDARAIEVVLNGGAVSDPSDLRAAAPEAVFYDYSGTLGMAFLAEQAGPVLAYLQFISRCVGPFACRRLAISADDGAATCTVVVITASDAAHLGSETLQRTFTGVPRDVAGFKATLSGTSPSYDYRAPPAEGDSIAYALATESRSATGSAALQIFIPRPIKDASFRVSAALNGEAGACDLAIVIRADDATHHGEWRNLARTAAALVGAIEGDPQEVGDYLRLLPPAEEGVVPDQAVTAPISSVVFLSFWETLVRGYRGQLPTTSLDFAPLQGATSTDESADLVLGSHLFRVVAGGTPDNGYPALVQQDAAPLPLAKPGIDGGWLAESPRYAVRIGTDNRLVVDTCRDVSVFTSPQSLTLEAWCAIDTPEVPYPGDDATPFPRILQGNPTDDGDRARYMLGLRATSAPMVVNDLSIAVGDGNVADPALRLVAGANATLQLYVLPDLSSTDFNNLLWTLTFDGVAQEFLRLTAAGQLQFDYLPAGSGEPQTLIRSSATLPTGKWSLVTLVHAGDSVALYLDRDAVGTASRPVPSSPTHRFVVAGNTRAPELQFRINEVAIWNRARGAAEIAEDYRSPVPRDDQALVLLWSLDERPADGAAVTNLAQATVGSYDTALVGSKKIWLIGGVFYRAFAAVRDGAVQSRDALIAPQAWHHIAAVYAPRYGMVASPESWADCGSDGSLDVDDGITLAAWVEPVRPASGLEQAVFGKYGSEQEQRSYLLELVAEGCPSMVVRVEGQQTANGEEVAERLKLHRFTAPEPLLAGAPAQLTGTVGIVETVDALGSGSWFSVSGQLYVDGRPTLPGPASPDLSDPSATTYRLDVLGGTGSGRYAAGTGVTVSVAAATRFSRWIADASADGASLFADAEVQTTTLTMPAADVTATGIGVSDSLRIAASSAPATIARVQTDVSDATLNLPYAGVVADLQLWSRPLGPDEVSDYVATGELPSHRDGLVSYWPFTEQEGVLAADAQFGNDATLTRSDAWVVLHAGAGIQLLIGGKPVPATRTLPGTYRGYGVAQFRLGDMLDDYSGSINPLEGELDEVRLWNRRRTLEQITDSMNGYLTGREAGLIGYWRFDVGSGATVIDRAVWGHDAHFDPPSGSGAPTWVTSMAPISDEAGEVRNALGGPDVAQVARVEGAPAVVEYGDVQRDAAGELFSVMKRLYLLPQRQLIAAVTGFKVGDLELIYLGQVQTDPTLVGYVEGPPPIPSENLTRPFWYDPTKPAYLGYYNSASVSLTEAEGLEVSFSGASQQATDHLFGFTAGLALNFTTEVEIGVPPLPATTIQTSYLSGKLGGGLDFDWGSGDSESGGWGHGLSQSRRYHFYNCGDWERPGPDGEVYLASGERRFVPNNEGIAVVRSLTADLYSTHLKTNGALVSLIVVPNADIPEDINLIYFPINPGYVKNGTLDGRLGLQPDPDYLDASSPYQSYFKPIEAYSLQQSIETKAASLESYYAQFDAAALGESGTTDLSEQRAENPLYDFEARVPRLDMVSTYVWTAAGGLYSESTGYVNTLQEAYGGQETFARTGKVIGEIAFAIGGPVGGFAEAHYNNQYTRNRSVSKDSAETAALSLEVAADPDGFLSRYIGGTTPPFAQPAYSADPVAGKVDGYRFKTFYLAPSEAAVDDFFSTVVDPIWLATSADARAAALRQAGARRDSGGAWRVMHRVTYVSRIPPAFQVYPLETAAPGTPDPANLEQNTALLALIDQRITAESPTAERIGDAVTGVFEKDLRRVLPWWGEFQQQAAVRNSDAEALWSHMKADTLDYALQYYDTRVRLAGDG